MNRTSLFLKLTIRQLENYDPVNEAQQSLQDLIDSVSQSHQPIVIAGQNSNAVLLSEAD